MKLFGRIVVVAVLLHQLIEAVPSYLQFNEDSISSNENLQIWKGRLTDLQKTASLYDNDFLATSSYAGALMSAGSHDNNVVLSKYRQLFEEFKLLFGRSYDKNDLEYEKRFKVFMESLQRHSKLNSREREANGTARYGINKFSDWTPAEFQTLLSNQNHQSDFQGVPAFQSEDGRYSLGSGAQPCSYYVKSYREKVDWRNKLSRIKNQGSCGSCWAFVGSEQIESYWAIKTGKMVERSPQELLSCSPSLGCEGGNTCLAMEWLQKNGVVLDTEEDYPYEEKDSACKHMNKTMDGPRVKALCGCRSLVGAEEVMLRLIDQRGPMGVNVDAVQWHDYTGGIIQHHCTNQNMNHAVQLIGYDLTSGPVRYWIARNQWGVSFGEDGFLRIKYGENMCGIAEQPSFIQV